MSVLQILHALPPASLRALDKYMASPYLVTHSGALRLYEYLRDRLRQDSPDLNWDKEAISRDLNETPLRLYHLANYLLAAVEQFLALEAWRQRPAEGHLLTIEALRRLRLGDHSAAMLRYARRRLEIGRAHV